MLFSLVLIVASNFGFDAYVIDENLTKQDCINRMLVMNKEFKNQNSELICHGTEEN